MWVRELILCFYPLSLTAHASSLTPSVTLPFLPLSFSAHPHEQLQTDGKNFPLGIRAFCKSWNGSGYPPPLQQMHTRTVPVHKHTNTHAHTHMQTIARICMRIFVHTHTRMHAHNWKSSVPTPILSLSPPSLALLIYERVRLRYHSYLRILITWICISSSKYTHKYKCMHLYTHIFTHVVRIQEYSLICSHCIYCRLATGG